jgi:biotin operon repressor
MFQWTDRHAKYVKPDFDMKAFFKEPLKRAIAERDMFKPLKETAIPHGQWEARELLKKQFYETLNKELYSKPKIVFIDMSDYDKQSRSRMNKHLEQIRDFWLKTRQYNVSVVVSIQAEMFKGHFLYGKIDAVTLEPLKPAELVEAYIRIWQNTEPFKPEALQLIAELSRGIFRRFMRYIQLCIERQQIMGIEGLIDAQFVNETVSFDQLVKDMDLELSDIFKQQQSKLEAVKILNLLRQCKEPLNQKQIANALSLSEASVGRYIEKLEANGYVRRKRDAHGQWMVELNA